ncbi:hypothetical protein [Cellulomonas sp. NS3]|uniref:hypothetical protein n=1 Tax=Cellulomonas sp. NS3 TaxID=2973977 RepID=UPI0021616785|nr:hypothetical protein [Cellulomonas sp. NS3]
MTADDALAHVVRELWALGASLGRTPEPTPEIDPWEEADPYPVDDVAAVVAFGGTPSVVVRLDRLGEDVVTLEDVLDVDVPRRDTVAVVESVLTGQAWVEQPRIPALLRWVGVMFGSAFPGTVRIPGGDGRTYAAPLPAAVSSGWLSRLPVVEEPGRERRRRERP